MPPRSTRALRSSDLRSSDGLVLYIRNSPPGSGNNSGSLEKKTGSLSQMNLSEESRAGLLAMEEEHLRALGDPKRRN